MLIFGGIIDAWEIILILAVVLILFASGHLLDVGRGFRSDVKGWGGAIRAIGRAIDGALESDHGRHTKVSGVVYEALTHDNRTAEFVYSHEQPDLVSDLILIVAQGFGVGRIQFAPGFFGSLLGVGWFLLLLSGSNLWVYLGGTVAGLAASVWFCGAAEKILKQKDPPSVVLDEIAAVPVCFLAWVAHDWLHHSRLPEPGSFFASQALPYTLLVFALFRLFDVVKPWPLRQSQRLPGGWGITVDDLLAGLYVSALSLSFIR